MREFHPSQNLCLRTHTHTHTRTLPDPSLFLSLFLICPFPGPGLRAAECLGKGAMESAEHPVGVSDESPPEAASLCGMDEPLRVGHLGQMSCSKDMEETESLVFERLLSPCSRAEESSHRLSPAWGLAFYGEDCFSHDVVEYAITLGQHSESPCLELKTQVGKLGGKAIELK